MPLTGLIYLPPAPPKGVGLVSSRVKAPPEKEVSPGFGPGPCQPGRYPSSFSPLTKRFSLFAEGQTNKKERVPFCLPFPLCKREAELKKELRFPFDTFRTGLWRVFLPVTLGREHRLKGGEYNSHIRKDRSTGFAGCPFYLSFCF